MFRSFFILICNFLFLLTSLYLPPICVWFPLSFCMLSVFNQPSLSPSTCSCLLIIPCVFSSFCLTIPWFFLFLYMFVMPKVFLHFCFLVLAICLLPVYCCCSSTTCPCMTSAFFIKLEFLPVSGVCAMLCLGPLLIIPSQQLFLKNCTGAFYLGTIFKKNVKSRKLRRD